MGKNGFFDNPVISVPVSQLEKTQTEIQLLVSGGSCTLVNLLEDLLTDLLISQDHLVFLEDFIISGVIRMVNLTLLALLPLQNKIRLEYIVLSEDRTKPCDFSRESGPHTMVTLTHLTFFGYVFVGKHMAIYMHLLSGFEFTILKFTFEHLIDSDFSSFYGATQLII